QNSATDNQKLGIMGRRNENSTTMGVFSVMQMSGLEAESAYLDGKEYSYASFFIKQPVVEEFANRVKELKSSTIKDFQTDSDILSELKNEIFQEIPEEFKMTTDNGNVIIKPKVFKKIGKDLTLT